MALDHTIGNMVFMILAAEGTIDCTVDRLDGAFDGTFD